MSRTLRWILMIPVAFAASVLTGLLATVAWNYALVDFTPDRWVPFSVSILKALTCPAAFVLAGSQTAPRRDWVVMIGLSVLYLAFEVVQGMPEGITEHLAWNLTMIAISIVSAAGAIAAVREASPTD